MHTEVGLQCIRSAWPQNKDQSGDMALAWKSMDELRACTGQGPGDRATGTSPTQRISESSLVVTRLRPARTCYVCCGIDWAISKQFYTFSACPCFCAVLFSLAETTAHCHCTCVYLDISVDLFVPLERTLFRLARLRVSLCRAKDIWSLSRY